MQTNAPLPTANTGHGFWGTCSISGWNATMLWNGVSLFIARRFDLSPEATRTLLDSRFGRHLADELSFIPGGPDGMARVEAHLTARFAQDGWQRWARRAMREAGVR